MLHLELTRRLGMFVLLGSLMACADPVTAPPATVRPPVTAITAIPGTTCPVAVLGPIVLTRTKKAPDVTRVTFAATPGTFYRLEATDLGTSGGNVRVWLNGVEVLPASAPPGERRADSSLSVTLQANNELEVRQAGRPGSQLEIRIVDVRQASSVRIAPTSRFLVVGMTRTYTATVLDAEGQPITRCVSWSTTNPSVATVEPNGTVHAVGVGSTELVAQVDGVQVRIPITVLQSAGPTTTNSFLGYCVVRAGGAGLPPVCFDAIVVTTPLVGGQTLIEVLFRNRQGSAGAESLPGSSISSVSILGPTAGLFALAQLGLSVSTQGNVPVVGSPAPMLGRTQITIPPHQGGQNFSGPSIGSLGVLGCASFGPRTPASYWQTCGNSAGLVDVAFIATGAFNASDLFIFVSFDAALETFFGGPLACATRPLAASSCQQLVPPLSK